MTPTDTLSHIKWGFGPTAAEALQELRQDLQVKVRLVAAAFL